MSTSTLLTNILSYISLIPTPPSNERRSSTLNLKSATASPLLSPKVTSATTRISAHVHAGLAAMEAETGQGQTQSECEHDERHERSYTEPNGTRATVLDCSVWRDGEREIMDDVSASFNISLISDTSTSISTPSSSADDLSLPPPPQLLLPSICAFPSLQHPASESTHDLLSRPFFMQEPEVYPYAYSTGGGLGLGVSVPSEKWDSDGGGEVIGGLGISGWRGLGTALYSLEEVEEEEG